MQGAGRAAWLLRALCAAAGYVLARITASGGDSSAAAESLPPMAEIGARVGCDKVTVHRYHRGYEAHLARRRREALRILEIGLGCDSAPGARGPGRSVRLWGEYLPAAALHVVELNGSCAGAFEAEEAARRRSGAAWGPRGGVTLTVGDQQDRGFLRSLREGAPAGGWDVIVDDGGHHPRQQAASFEGLWAALAPGGLYVIEDIQTSFWTLPGAPPLDPPPRRGQLPFTDYLATQVLPRLHTVVAGGGWEVDNQFRSEVARVDCWHFVCFVSKAGDPVPRHA
eukprot:TRINITY_DN66547_c0_g1_i1.p1 TRINITY_DN66547_c0_g1~~TRINITY_DN66547_c0_g1_i1.p1  ORF type:complete len:308 (+),score=80.61 TRINITY_DN66547_c0_g1_i1:79-924(+)